MKKIFILLLLMVAVHSSKGQNIKAQCPPGYDHVGGGVFIDKFNLHKARTDCKKGFGICLETTAFLKCQRGLHVIYVSVENSKVTGTIIVINDTAEVYLPVALKNDPEFANEDMGTFYVEHKKVSLRLSDDESWIVYLKEGEYPVKKTDEALIIKIPVEY